MSDIETGGPAFPKSLDPYPNVQQNTSGGSDGMSLRDWFAGQALAGLATVFFGAGGNTDYPEAARRSYEIADAMLVARAAAKGAK